MDNHLLFIVIDANRDAASEASGLHLIACVGGQFLSQMCQAAQSRVDNFPAFHTNEMRMGVWVVSIVPVLLVAEFELQYFSEFLDDRDGFVNGGKTSGREVDPDLLDVFNTGMPSALSQYPKYGNALGCDAVSRFLELLEYQFRADRCPLHVP